MTKRIALLITVAFLGILRSQDTREAPERTYPVPPSHYKIKELYWKSELSRWHCRSQNEEKELAYKYLVTMVEVPDLFFENITDAVFNDWVTFLDSAFVVQQADSIDMENIKENMLKIIQLKAWLRPRVSLPDSEKEAIQKKIDTVVNKLSSAKVIVNEKDYMDFTKVIGYGL